MARSAFHPDSRPAFSCSLYSSLFIIMVATLSMPALVQADSASQSPTFQLYFLTPATIIILNPPQNEANYTAFSAVFSNVPHESPAADSPVVGQILGQLSRFESGLEYTAFTNILNTSKYTGSIEVQGPLDAQGNGELAITGGTGDFRKASGYVKFEVNVDNVNFRSSFFISYD